MMFCFLFISVSVDLIYVFWRYLCTAFHFPDFLHVHDGSHVTKKKWVVFVVDCGCSAGHREALQ